MKSLLAAIRYGTLLTVIAIVFGCGSQTPEPPVTADNSAGAVSSPGPASSASKLDDPPPAPPPSVQNQFWSALTALCGQAYAGRLTVGTEESDRSVGEVDLVMDVRQCSDNEIRIPFHVGENRSRTWFVRRAGNRFTLDHRHRDEQGHAHDPTGYGGATSDSGSATRQVFMVNPKTVGMLPETWENVWAMEVIPGKVFAYELKRPSVGRHFRVEFPLHNPPPAPPEPWGGI